MTDYSSLSAEPKQFHALTAYTLEEFDALLLTIVYAAGHQGGTFAGVPNGQPEAASAEANAVVRLGTSRR